MTPLAAAARPVRSLVDQLGDAVERMIRIEMEHLPQHWSEADRREMAEKALLGERGVTWQPIETAFDCEDGVLVCDASKPHPVVGLARYIDGKWRGAHLVYGFASDCFYPTPTHWQPLPDPPASPDLSEKASGEGEG